MLERPYPRALSKRRSVSTAPASTAVRLARDTPAPLLLVAADRTLVEQLATWVRQRINEGLFRAGSRVPSIRRLAAERGISRFTVVEAYERLVAGGYLESRRGSGFYVRDPATRRSNRRDAKRAERSTVPASTDASRVDARWLVQNMFRQMPAQQMPGSGLPPPEWMDGDLLASGLRAVGRRGGVGFLDYGTPQGYLPLRSQLQWKLAGAEIAADPAQIVLTSGATQAFDLIARHFIVPGDTVLVDDPAWFLMFGLFAAHGARVIGVPRLADGPDLATLERLAAQHKPRFYVVDSVLHNPTSTSLSAAKAFQILKLADAHDFIVVEDDVYGDLHPGSAGGRGLPATRMASLDQLNRVIHVGSFSKTLAANLRVGFIACAADLAPELAEHKMLAALTTPEVGERIVHRVLVEGHYRKHVERLRGRFDSVRDRAVRGLERAGLVVENPPAAGMFLWAGAHEAHGRKGDGSGRGIDTTVLAARMFDLGFLLAPGGLFSPSQLPNDRLRFNIATSSNPQMLDALARTIQDMA